MLSSYLQGTPTVTCHEFDRAPATQIATTWLLVQEMGADEKPKPGNFDSNSSCQMRSKVFRMSNW